MPDWGGDERFAELVLSRRGELLRVAMLITGNKAEAEDAVQDAIVSVSSAWVNVSARAGYAYLRTAVVRKALDGRRAPASTELPERPYEELGFLRLEEDRAFIALLRTLPSQQRAALVLRYYNGLDTGTIAQVLQIGRSAVRSHIARGLASLRASTTGKEAAR